MSTFSIIPEFFGGIVLLLALGVLVGKLLKLDSFNSEKDPDPRIHKAID